MYISENMPRWNLQWIDKIKSNMSDFEDYTFDIKSDLLRIRSKIQEYQDETGDAYGWQHVKDYVRCTFYFQDPEKLLLALKNFINN